jgi:hypothetical protein
MNPHRIWAVMYRHSCETRRNLNRITDVLYLPVQNMIFWGFFTLYLAREHRLGNCSPPADAGWAGAPDLKSVTA